MDWIKELLPVGWDTEEIPHEPEQVVLVAENRVGFVTVNFRERNWCLGWGYSDAQRRNFGGPGPRIFSPVATVSPTGRGWRERITQEAVKDLQMVLHGDSF